MSKPSDLAEPVYEHVVFPCGCWFERKGPDEFAFQVCTNCWETKLDMLTQMSIDRQDQLTLPLPSTEGDRSERR